jgi:hypothetical protein
MHGEFSEMDDERRAPSIRPENAGKKEGMFALLDDDPATHPVGSGASDAAAMNIPAVTRSPFARGQLATCMLGNRLGR